MTHQKIAQTGKFDRPQNGGGWYTAEEGTREVPSVSVTTPAQCVVLLKNSGFLLSYSLSSSLLSSTHLAFQLAPISILYSHLSHTKQLSCYILQ